MCRSRRRILGETRRLFTLHEKSSIDQRNIQRYGRPGRSFRRDDSKDASSTTASAVSHDASGKS